MHTSDSAEIRVILNLCEKVRSTKAVEVYQLILEQDWKALALVEIGDPALYSSAYDFALDYAIVKFLSKWKGLPTGIDTRRRALDLWTEAEEKCLTMNRFFFNYSGLSHFYEGPVGRAFALAQRKIAMVLGRPKLGKLFSECKWSNGATFDLRRGATVVQKMSGRISVTRPSLNYLRRVLESDLHWCSALIGQMPEGQVSLLPCNFQVVRGNRFLTVPKDAKTDRCISAEPTGNMFLQQGLHAYMRKRMKRFGVDLDDQTINQKFASQAHKLGLSTIDLSSASDTISRGLVYNLLPSDWYLLLDDLRSHESLVDGEWRRLSKFASMGNAFTFELETLIFWALTKAVEELEGSRHDIYGIPSVYGDDIIIHRDHWDLTIEVLSAAGFKTNEKKSYRAGLFFESCGGHFFNGVNVTPMYQKEISDTRQELIRLHNRISRWSLRTFGDHCADEVKTSLRIVRRMFQHFGDRHEPRIPFNCYGDDGFLVAASSCGPYDINHGYYCRVYIPKVHYKKAQGSYLLAYKLRRPSYQSADPKGQSTVASDAGYRYGRVYRHDWNDPS